MVAGNRGGSRRIIGSGGPRIIQNEGAVSMSDYGTSDRGSAPVWGPTRVMSIGRMSGTVRGSLRSTMIRALVLGSLILVPVDLT